MQITLRPVTRQDCKMLFHLLKDRPNYANISHNKMPSWAEHVAFVTSDPYKYWYIAEGLNLGSTVDVGAVYLTDKDEIGVGVLRKFWHKGYGSSAVREIMRAHPLKRYYANVSPTNVASQKLFKDLGFGILQYTYDKEGE